MTPSDDLSPPRRPIFFPVVIATVFLTIIGLTAGFVLGERHNNAVQAEQTQSSETVPEPEPVFSSAPSGKLCPQETIDKAGEIGLSTDLRQVMKIQTDGGTTVWICRDPAGALYYQGKTGGRDAKLVQGTNGLLLSDVVQVGDQQYKADDKKGNRFLITSDSFEHTKPDGSQISDRAVLLK